MLKSITNFWKHFGKQISKENYNKIPKYNTQEVTKFNKLQKDYLNGK